MPIPVPQEIQDVIDAVKEAVGPDTLLNVFVADKRIIVFYNGDTAPPQPAVAEWIIEVKPMPVNPPAPAELDPQA